jgi:hypothetical protein
MLKRTQLLSRLAAVTFPLLLAAGCAHQDVQAPGLGLRRVVIYRNGVGYFERQGRVDADEVNFRVRREKVGDFLATLAVVEQGGSSVRSASFPISVGDPPDDAEDEDLEADAAPPAPGRRRVDIALESPPPKKRKAAKKDEMERVTLSLDGKEHELVVGYVAETPVWRPSYRLVLTDTKGKDAQPSAELQAWGIVQNLSGEDWKGVRLSLVAGAPLAFQSTLEQPVIPQRPIVTDRGEVISAVPLGQTSLEQAPPPPPAEASPMEDLEERESYGYSYNGSPAGSSAGVGMGRGDVPKQSAKRKLAESSASRPSAAPAPSPAQAPRLQSPSPPRNVSALAAVALEGGTTRYDLPFAVDVPNKSATMVLLLSQAIPGQSVFLFAPDGGVPESAFHPFRVARFVNMTSGLLERGPIAIYEKGAFLGQGMVEPLPPRASATVPFALERGLSVAVSRDSERDGARLAKIEGGLIEIERDQVLLTKYEVKNGLADEARILLRHARTPGTRLHEPPKQTEDNVGLGNALVPFTLAGHATAEIKVDERSTFRTNQDPLSSLAGDAVRAYVADPRANKAIVDQLKAAWEVRGKLKVAVDERSILEQERMEIERTSDELRRNLRAIEKNKAADELRRDLTARLGRASARHDEIEKREITLGLQIAEQSIRLRDQLAAIKLRAPLPVP